MIIASSGIIIDDNKILLIKRSNYTSVFPGYRACPGGRAEENETPEENVIREIKEEVGLDFKPIELFKIDTYDDRMLYRFIGTWSGTLMMQKEEIADWKWFTYEESIDLPLAFDYRDVIELLHIKKLI